MSRVVISALADGDIDAHVAYLAERNPASAERFLTALIDELNQLAEHRELGRRYPFKNPVLKEVRAHGIRGFRKYLIFYIPLGDDGIEAIRILHGARDIEAIFAT
jgi:toxin ParE1/3/4